MAVPIYKDIPLFRAAHQNDLEGVKKLIAEGCNLNQGHHLKTALHVAIFNGCYKVVKLLVEAGADVSIKAGVLFQLTPLEYAAEKGQFNCFKELIGSDTTSDYQEIERQWSHYKENVPSDVQVLLNKKIIDSDETRRLLGAEEVDLTLKNIPLEITSIVNAYANHGFFDTENPLNPICSLEMTFGH